MPEDLHEKLSEFSFGYGITRDVEREFSAVGLSTTPFFPNLRQENTVGYDVKFNRRGGALLLQFKLGEELVRYRRRRDSTCIPILERPFWRVFVDTLEPRGQFDVLFSAERSGCEVYYAAPRFATWDAYAETFISNKVLESSLLIAPSMIDERLKAAGEPDGVHRIIYDQINLYVESEPITLPHLPPDRLAQRMRHNIEEGSRVFKGRRPIGSVLHYVVEVFEALRRVGDSDPNAFLLQVCRGLGDRLRVLTAIVFTKQDDVFDVVRKIGR